MKKLLIAAMLVLTAVSVAGCSTMGKGKGPVETNG